jgi:hypothetical protein
MAHAYVEKKCDQCSKQMRVHPSFIHHGRGKYCSKKCAYTALSEIKAGKKPKYLWGKPSCKASN